MWFELSLWQTLLLIISSFIGSLLTAAVGVGGGSFLIIVMAYLVPPIALIPVHAIVQLGSNSGRAWLTREHRQNKLVLWFLTGTLAAIFFGILLLDKINTQHIPLICAMFILYLCWGPLPTKGLNNTPIGLALGGLITTLASVLVGASGPLVSAWLGRNSSPLNYTANFSTCMVLQHGLKLIVFGWVGFNYFPWLTTIIAMVAAGFIGTKLGLKLLNKMPTNKFKQIFKWLLSGLALNLIIQALLKAI